MGRKFKLGKHELDVVPVDFESKFEMLGQVYIPEYKATIKIHIPIRGVEVATNFLNEYGQPIFLVEHPSSSTVILPPEYCPNPDLPRILQDGSVSQPVKRITPKPKFER